MRYKIFAVLIVILLLGSLTSFAHEEDGIEFDDDFDEDSLVNDGDFEEFSCSNREECMELCRQHPRKCKFESEERSEEGRTEEKLRIRGEYGDFRYRYKSENGGQELEVEFEKKSYFDYFDEKPEYFILGKITEGMTTEESMRFPQMCPDTEGMVDALINYLKETNRWNLEKSCNGIENELNRCRESSSDQCKNIKESPWLKFDDAEVECGDSASKEIFYEICSKKRNSFDEGLEDLENQCERNWENVEEECDRGRERCRELETETRENAGDISDTNSLSCDLGPNCDREEFMQRCKSEVGSGIDEARNTMREECNRMAEDMLQNFRKSCDEREQAYNRCIEYSQKHCGVLERVWNKCNSIDEEQLRTVMLEHGRRMCKFMENKDDAEFFSKMLEAKGHFRKGEYNIVIEEEAEAVVEAREEVKTIEDKSFGYKIKKFFCLAADEERGESSKLREIANRFREKSEIIKDLAGEAESEQGRTALDGAGNLLNEEAGRLEVMADKKEEKAAGLCSVFKGEEEQTEVIASE